jgi:hypothetical protein
MVCGANASSIGLRSYVTHPALDPLWENARFAVKPSRLSACPLRGEWSLIARRGQAKWLTMSSMLALDLRNPKSTFTEISYAKLWKFPEREQ